MASYADTFCDKKLLLNNGLKMPAVGMGTYRVRHGDDIMKVVDCALDSGYRMFDTAAVYGNETHIKTAFKTLLPKYGLEREDIFITTKLSPSNHGIGEVVERAYQKSLSNLGLDYVDLYLIHFPGTAKLNGTDPRNEKMRNLTWSALVDLYENGEVNAIGVSNFTVKHLQNIYNHDHSVIPAVNQVEWHPYYHQTELFEYCNKNEIILQAYCPLGGTSCCKYSLIEEPVVKKIATKLNVTCAQVLLAWVVQQDIGVIPKSTNPEHIRQNININFTIPDEDMKALNVLGSKNLKYAWDPSNIA